MGNALPPLNGLRAFEAAARHGSITEAAAELHVTPGAVSLQIKELEAVLGQALFVRAPRCISLTPAGRQYFEKVRHGFRLLREATAELTARTAPPTLTLACTAGFAAQWLVPRLPKFTEAHPDIDVRINASNQISDFARDGIDLAVRHGGGRYEGLISERLLDDGQIPVCSPALRQRIALSALDDLRRAPLLHDEAREDWRLWLDAAGVRDVDLSRGPVFSDSNLLVEAARSGLGIALIRASLVERELEDGRLIAPFPYAFPSGLAYYLVYPPGALDRPIIASFRDWLLAEARRCK